MGKSPTISHKVRIGDQFFNVRIAEDETERYDRIAAYADEALQDIREDGFNGAQLWAMTTFQLTIELFEARALLKEGEQNYERMDQIFDRMLQRIEGALPAE